MWFFVLRSFAGWLKIHDGELSAVNLSGSANHLSLDNDLSVVWVLSFTEHLPCLLNRCGLVLDCGILLSSIRICLAFYLDTVIFECISLPSIESMPCFPYCYCLPLRFCFVLPVIVLPPLETFLCLLSVQVNEKECKQAGELTNKDKDCRVLELSEFW